MVCKSLFWTWLTSHVPIVINSNWEKTYSKSTIKALKQRTHSKIQGRFCIILPHLPWLPQMCYMMTFPKILTWQTVEEGYTGYLVILIRRKRCVALSKITPKDDNIPSATSKSITKRLYVIFPKILES